MRGLRQDGGGDPVDAAMVFQAVDGHDVEGVWQG